MQRSSSAGGLPPCVSPSAPSPASRGELALAVTLKDRTNITLKKEKKKVFVSYFHSKAEICMTAFVAHAHEL